MEVGRLYNDPDLLSHYVAQWGRDADVFTFRKLPTPVQTNDSPNLLVHSLQPHEVMEGHACAFQFPVGGADLSLNQIFKMTGAKMAIKIVDGKKMVWLKTNYEEQIKTSTPGGDTYLDKDNGVYFSFVCLLDIALVNQPGGYSNSQYFVGLNKYLKSIREPKVYGR